MGRLTRPQCYTCGGELVERDDGKFVCQSCGNVYGGEEKKPDDELVSQLNLANQSRVLRHFDEAGEMYEDIIAKHPDEVFAYWGAFLSEYGIEYVDDNGKFKPICHRVSRIPATGSHYLTALYENCATEADRQSYRMMADEVEGIRYRIYELSRSQEPYDVFICYGGSPEEASRVNELVTALGEKGMKVFVPQRSGARASDLEAYIYNAISSAEFMFVVAGDLDSLKSTRNIWGRFLDLEGKKVQVVHNALDESDFPSKLRRFVQRQAATINYRDPYWLKTALAFADRKKEEKPAESPVVVAQQDTARLEEIARRVDNLEVAAHDLPEAFLMALTYISLMDVSNAERVINIQLDRFDPQAVRPVADLCLELLKLTKAGDAERRNCMARISAIASRIKAYYPVITDRERFLYPQIKRAGLLVYLAKCFGVIRDTARQCFVLDLVDYEELYDFRLANEFVTMLFNNGRGELVKEVLRAVPRLDGDYILPMFLNKFTGAQKPILLAGIADKLVCTDKVTDELNKYLSTCNDLTMCLTLVDIMTRNGLLLSATGMDGALSTVQTPSQARIILANYGKRAVSGMDVDKLVAIATNDPDVANEVLRHLKYDSGISDLGAHNMRELVTKCDLAKIKAAFFDFPLDRKLAERLLADAVNGNGDDRLSTIKILSEIVPVVNLDDYSRTLLGNDPLKKQIVEMLAPKTGKFANANPVFEQYLRGKDSDATKRAIIAMYGDFPFNDRVLELYLSIYPDSYDAAYEKYLFAYLEAHSGKAREIFVNQYEKLIGGYERVLPRILATIQYMDDDSIVRFVLDFRGTQLCKNALFLYMLRFPEKAKKIEVNVNGTICNLLQAYLFTMRDITPTTAKIVEELRKKGVSGGDKIVIYGKKCKPQDYLVHSALSQELKSEIEKYLK